MNTFTHLLNLKFLKTNTTTIQVFFIHLLSISTKINTYITDVMEKLLKHNVININITLLSLRQGGT